MTSADFITLLEQHDWYYDRADDNRAYAKGAKSRDRLLHICQQWPELFRLYNYAQNCIIRALPFDFQSITGTTQVKDEKQHTHPSNMTNELFKSFFDICIKPLVEAINNLASGNLNTPVAPIETAIIPTPVADKPAKTKAPKAEKTAPAAEEPAAETISEARLKATVTTLPNDGKIKLKAYFQKKFGYNTMAEIAEENRADIHAAAVKIGATDTDPEADAGDM